MKYWIVVHDRPAYLEEPNYIGKSGKYGKINKISKGDKVLYYSRGESVIINSFDVVTNGQEKQFPENLGRQAWAGNLFCYRIRARLKKQQVNAPMGELLSALKLKTFPTMRALTLKIWSRTSVEISKNDFSKIEKFLKSYKPNTTKLFQGPANEGNLGEPIDLEILNYAPTSEQGVVVLFAAFIKQLRPYHFVKMEFVRSGFPDACVIEKTGNLYARKYIEFEFRASSFRIHEKNPKHKLLKCDYVVCWENDYVLCPIPVIELKTELKKLLAKKAA